MIKFDDKTMQSWLNKGGFVVSGGNIMTASWGFLGNMWHKKVVILPIRDSRFTKTFLDSTKEFTFSVPFEGKMKKELTVCGTQSGRDVDKWEVTKLTKSKAKKVNTVVVGGCEHFFECKVLAVLDMKSVDIGQVNKFYEENDLHNFYIGEIVAEYCTAK